MKSHSAADARPYQWQKRVLPALFHLRCPSQSRQRSARGRTRLTTVTSISCRSLWRQLLYLSLYYFICFSLLALSRRKFSRVVCLLAGATSHHFAGSLGREHIFRELHKFELALKFQNSPRTKVCVAQGGVGSSKDEKQHSSVYRSAQVIPFFLQMLVFCPLFAKT